MLSVVAERKLEIVKKFGKSDADTGLSEVQIALLTADIERLTEHFKSYAKDNHSRRGLIRKVNRRRKLLSYLKKNHRERYYAVISALKLRG